MDALLYISIGIAAIAGGLTWLAVRRSAPPTQEPGTGAGDREPRDPRPLVGIAANAKEEPWPERDDPGG